MQGIRSGGWRWRPMGHTGSGGVMGWGGAVGGAAAWNSLRPRLFLQMEAVEWCTELGRCRPRGAECGRGMIIKMMMKWYNNQYRD